MNGPASPNPSPFSGRSFSCFPVSVASRHLRRSHTEDQSAASQKLATTAAPCGNHDCRSYIARRCSTAQTVVQTVQPERRLSPVLTSCFPFLPDGPGVTRRGVPCRSHQTASGIPRGECRRACRFPVARERRGSRRAGAAFLGSGRDHADGSEPPGPSSLSGGRCSRRAWRSGRGSPTR
uniref:Uncharacterized protein n=1 Tax=uncultured marine virus TaxID=186617 RepID=A0A0F7LAL3_9VIRU|nr:hypothetical protein [uncultured marine virus]